MTNAWHFVGDKLRDGAPIPADGETLVHAGKLIMCKSGLHASERIIDALRYAPGTTICRVRLSGDNLSETDKMVAPERTILWRVDGEELLGEFARQCALDVLDLWDAPDVLREYLETGDESKRAAARAAARGAARGAAWEAARGAAWAAAWGARAAAETAAAAAGAAATARAASGGAARGAAWRKAAQNERLEMMVRNEHSKHKLD